MFPERIETERLVLERLRRENVTARALYERFSDPALVDAFEHVPQDPYRTVREPRDWIERAERAWEDAESAEYVVRVGEGEDEDAGTVAGTTGLFLDWERRTGRLGLILHPDVWGRGYSGERAAAMLELAFDRLDLELVAVTHGSENERSRRAIGKYVDRFGGSRDVHLRNWAPMDDGVSDEIRYAIPRGAYLDATN